MTDRNLILYIAMSLDGFIAKEDGDISWLSVVEAAVEDYGYGMFINTVDTVIMGRKTYETILSMDVDFPHRDKKCYVVSRNKSGKDKNVEFYNGDLSELINRLRNSPGKDIFCDGGAELVFELMKLNLIDRYIISIIPISLGAGIPLFKPGRPEQKLKFIKSQAFPSGLLQLWYNKT